MQQIADDGEGNRIDDMDPMFDGYDLNPDVIPDSNVQLLGGSNERRDWLRSIPWKPQQEESISGLHLSSSFDKQADYEDTSDDLMSLEDNLAKLRHEPEFSDDDEEFNKFFESSMRNLSETKVDGSDDDENHNGDDLDGLIYEYE